MAADRALVIDQCSPAWKANEQHEQSYSMEYALATQTLHSLWV